jgi:hypothetical protein
LHLIEGFCLLGESLLQVLNLKLPQQL